MSSVLISLGANLGNNHETMVAASGMIREVFGRSQVCFSRLYRTAPVGGPRDQSDFLNAVARVETQLSCWEVWEAIRRIESDLGRRRLQRWEARRLDLDILLQGDLRIWTPHLKIPHPRMCMRSFVLIPAMDVAAEMIEPVSGWTIDRLSGNLPRAHRAKTVVWSNSEVASRELEAAMGRTTKLDGSFQFGCCSVPEQIFSTRSETEPDAPHEALHIYCVQTPEPETIRWEDFLYPWAKTLGLVGPGCRSKFSGLRYLLPNNDLEWTAHEIISAREAMTCPIVPTGRPFPPDP
jgi:2-amino-4-hydroxy-6-hydroxymethyldihydropteridine diphosphokinase